MFRLRCPLGCSWPRGSYSSLSPALSRPCFSSSFITVLCFVSPGCPWCSRQELSRTLPRPPVWQVPTCCHVPGRHQGLCCYVPNHQHPQQQQQWQDRQPNIGDRACNESADRSPAPQQPGGACAGLHLLPPPAAPRDCHDSGVEAQRHCPQVTSGLFIHSQVHEHIASTRQ